LRPRFLADTHIVIRWLTEARRLSRDQFRIFKEADRRGELIGISPVSLLEIVALTGSRRLALPTRAFLEDLEANPLFQLLPITYEVAFEISALFHPFGDPFDRAIVATARVHGLRLITSDEAIIHSKLVATVE
jgi:PIN domain nuclease of toxin-antitoxin system